MNSSTGDYAIILLCLFVIFAPVLVEVFREVVHIIRGTKSIDPENQDENA